MNHFEQQTCSISPEKLPSISILPSNGSVSFSDQRAPSYDLYQQQNVVSPPLTPAVSPSSMLIDNLKYQRKYSVDVGPFGFGSGNVMLPHHLLQEEYRRGSSDMTANHHSSPPPPQQQQMHMDPPTNNYHFLHPSPFSMVENDGIMQKKSNSNAAIISNPIGSTSQNQKSRRPSRFIGQPGPNTQHKHVCKYSHCGWSFKRYEHLKRHMLVHTGERPHVCPFQGCGKCFSRSDNFHAHYRTHTKKAIIQQQIPSTGKPNTKKQQKKQLQQDQQQQSLFTSDYDRMNMNPYEMYDQRPSIYSHQDHLQYMRPYDINSVSPYPISNPAFSDPAISNNHHHSFDANIDVQPYNYSPPTDTSYSSSNTSPVPFHPSSQLRRSSSSTSSSKDGSFPSPDTNRKTHCCPEYQCQRSFKRLEHLKRHMRTHTMERPFACTFPHCNKTFSRSDNLSQHQKTHTRTTSNRKSPQSEFTMHQQEPTWSMNNVDC